MAWIGRRERCISRQVEYTFLEKNRLEQERKLNWIIDVIDIKKTYLMCRGNPFIADEELACHHGTFVRVMVGDVALAYLENLCVKRRRSKICLSEL